MPLNIEELALDPDREVHGQWVDAGDGCRLLIARKGNAQYEKLLRRVMGPAQRKAELGRLTNEEARELFSGVMAKTILLGWEGLTEGGRPVEYSPENAERMLKTYRLFYEMVDKLSEDAQLFRLGQQKEDAEALGEG